jgi:hypothetical protein
MSLQTTILRGNIYQSFLVYPSLTPASVSGTQATQTFSISGLNVNDSVNMTLNGAQTTGVGIANAWVSAANVLSVQFTNSTGSAATPAAGTYILAIDRLEGTILPTNAA